jgi:hypothetical protein
MQSQIAVELVEKILIRGEMKITNVEIALFVMALGVTSPSLAQQSLTGNQLLTKCEQAERLLSMPGDSSSQDDVVGTFQCIGYISGVLHGFLIGSSVKIFCMPNVPDSQLIRLTLARLRSNPQYLHEPAGVQVVVALRDAFPCR